MYACGVHYPYLAHSIYFRLVRRQVPVSTMPKQQIARVVHGLCHVILVFSY
jgi:hypothetical protein